MRMAKWHGINSLKAEDFRCGYCGREVAADKGYFRDDEKSHYIRICPRCAKPTYFDAGKQVPDIAPGNEVKEVPEDVNGLYVEARNCISVSAYTASVLASRKLLMNIAVTQGADEGKKFVEYVQYLADNGYVPPNGEGWVDHVRKKGNEATHEIPHMEREDAEELITFAEMLLKFIYEFPARVPGAQAPQAPQGSG